MNMVEGACSQPSLSSGQKGIQGAQEKVHQVRDFIWHMANLSLILSITYGPQIPPGVITECRAMINYWVWPNMVGRLKLTRMVHGIQVNKSNQQESESSRSVNALAPHCPSSACHPVAD